MKIYETQSLISGQEITKIRTKLFKNAKKIKNEIITNFPGVITDIFGADEAGLTEEVVPLSLTVGTDGTTREVEDSSGETQKIILAAASAVGIINKNNIEFKNDVLVDPVVVRTDGKHDLLIMKCLEYKTFNQLCKKLDKETLFIFDGSIWNILEDLRYLINFSSPKILKLFVSLLIFFKFKLFVIKTGLIFFLGINKPAKGLVEFHSSNDLRFSRYAT